MLTTSFAPTPRFTHSATSFRCAKCKTRVESDSNLLLLSDGSPICEQCSYSCKACHKPILDEAIMTGKSPSFPHVFPFVFPALCISCVSIYPPVPLSAPKRSFYFQCLWSHKGARGAMNIVPLPLPWLLSPLFSFFAGAKEGGSCFWCYSAKTKPSCGVCAQYRRRCLPRRLLPVHPMRVQD